MVGGTKFCYRWAYSNAAIYIVSSHSPSSRDWEPGNECEYPRDSVVTIHFTAR